MNLYLDDDSAAALLVTLLRRAGHDVRIPADVGLSGEDDPVHLAHVVQADRVFLSHNLHDFQNLHNLILACQGLHGMGGIGKSVLAAVARDRRIREAFPVTRLLRLVRSADER